MTYEQLQKLLPNDEINYIQDSINNPDDSINLSEFSDESKYEFILYSFVIDCVPETLKTLLYNKIPFILKYDEHDQAYIIITKDHYTTKYDFQPTINK